MPRDELTVPSEERIRGDQSCHFPEEFPSKLFPLGRKPSTLLVAQAQPLTELRLQNTVLLLQILKDLLLLLVQPTGQERDQEDLWRDKWAHRKHRSQSHLRLRKMTD